MAIHTVPATKRWTQRRAVLNHLKTFGNITPVTALRDYGIFRLAARIDELRKEYEIETQRVGEKRYARYVLRS